MPKTRVTKRSGIAIRHLDMPLPRGRQAKSLLVFGRDASYFQLGNLLDEGPVLWTLQLARTEKATAEEMAESFSPHGSRFVNSLMAGVPAAPSEGELPAGADLTAIDGLTEFGIQTSDDHEYFLSKFGDLVGVLRIQRKQDGTWKAGLEKSNLPRVLSPDAVSEGLMPPSGYSGLPKSLEAVVPQEHQYWKAQGDQARSMRDALVESGFFSDDCIKAVDGELRKVVVRHFLYDPAEAQAESSKAEKGLSPLLHRVEKIVTPDRFEKVVSPMAESDDWLEFLDTNDVPGTLVVLSPANDGTTAREMARAVKSISSDYFLEHNDTRINRAAFHSVGLVFKIVGSPNRVFCTSFAPSSLDDVVLLKQVRVKTTEFQGLPISIDRPAGYVQTGKDENGNEWERTYQTDYGFLPRTRGGDGEELDVFVGSDGESKRVFWVTQNKADGTFDEYKVFVGFTTPRDARDCYITHIPSRFYGSMSETTIEQLKAMAGVDPVELAKRLAANAVVKVAGVPYEEVRRAAAEALNIAYPAEEGSTSPCYSVYPEDLYDDAVIYAHEGKLWRQGFSYSGGTVTLAGSPEQVARTYQPVAAGTTSEPDANVQARDATPPDPMGKLNTAFDRYLSSNSYTPSAKRAVGALKEAIGYKEMLARSLRIATTKADGEEHYVLGIVLEPDIIDAQDDTYTADEVRAASERFMEMHRNLGLMHKQKVNDKVQILENYIAPVDMLIGDIKVKKGTWLMGVRVKDESLWKAVKDGDLTGFSIGGSAIRTPTSQDV